MAISKTDLPEKVKALILFIQPEFHIKSEV